MSDLIDKDVFEELRQQFVSEFTSELNRVEAAAEDAKRDPQKRALVLRQAADYFHGLAGVAETFGLGTLGRLASICDNMGNLPNASPLQNDFVFELLCMALNATRDSLRDVERIAAKEKPLAFPERQRIITEPIFEGGKKNTIAIVDDDATSRAIIESCLVSSGYQTMAVNNPHEAVEKISEGLPDLILLDVAMPGLDGFTLCERLRQNPALSLVPILFVTAKNDTAQKVKGLTVGGNDYIEKPFNPDELVARVAAHLERLRTIRELAIRDSLTGVYNHKYFETLLDQEVKRAQRYDSTMSLALLDVDYFKRINDEHGHQAGDSVLSQFVRVVQGQLRGSDVVGRWGGDEFVVLLTHTPLPAALGVMNRIARAVGNVRVGTASDHVVTTSIGVTGLLSTDTTPGVIERADQALYQAKREGRARVASL